MKINKTNVARLLDKAKVAYQLVPYEVDENDLSATHVADQLGENVAQVFKTLVLHGDKSGYFVCVIPGADEVDLKKAAKVSGNKSCEMIPVKELLTTPPDNSITFMSVPDNGVCRSGSLRRI